MRRKLVLLTAAGLAAAGCETGKAEARLDPASGESGGGNSTRLVTRTAAAEVERSDPENGPKGAQAIAEKHKGYVESSSSSSATLRVPSAELDASILELATLGKVVSQETHSRDVTFQHLDTDVRLNTLRKERERYLELLAKAPSVTDALAVEKELERVTGEIERLEGELKLMDSQVELASLDVRFSRPVRPGPVGWVFYGVFSAVKWLFVWD
jgi:hypothetical protein